MTLEIDPNGPNNMERGGVVHRDYAKYRCRSAKVIKIENVLTGETAKIATSGHDEQFCYKVGEMVEEPYYNTEIEIVCGEGIHFFMTKEPAVFYALLLMKFEGYTGEWMEWCDNGQRIQHVWYKDGKKILIMGGVVCECPKTGSWIAQGWGMEWRMGMLV